MSETTVPDPDAGVPEAKDASTVMLVRDGATGPEVFLQRRAGAMEFAAGMTAFPGGRVDPVDAAVAIEWAGPPPRWWGERLGVSDARAKALVCAAVRETFEECGVLLAGLTADTVVADTGGYRAERERIEGRDLTLAEFLAARQLVLRADLLRPWSRWITPTVERRRYDTNFFVAVLPEGQLADGATTETDLVQWSTPAAALDTWKAGEHVLLPPTWSQLTSLADYRDTAQILAAEPQIDPIQPEFGEADGKKLLQFPDNMRYFADLPDPSRLVGSKGMRDTDPALLGGSGNAGGVADGR
ncbi:NUDIX hydrolase [Nocardia sp. NBC_01329]|uniref:NUDIX hydrolase n=1 Tax=Nocardia sp. NBC_01329 TaxID=2903594 RepID=UPI003FA3DCAA